MTDSSSFGSGGEGTLLAGALAQGGSEALVREGPFRTTLDVGVVSFTVDYYPVSDLDDVGEDRTQWWFQVPLLRISGGPAATPGEAEIQAHAAIQFCIEDISGNEGL